MGCALLTSKRNQLTTHDECIKKFRRDPYKIEIEHVLGSLHDMNPNLVYCLKLAGNCNNSYHCDDTKCLTVHLYSDGRFCHWCESEITLVWNDEKFKCRLEDIIYQRFNLRCFLMNGFIYKNHGKK